MKKYALNCKAENSMICLKILKFVLHEFFTNHFLSLFVFGSSTDNGDFSSSRNGGDAVCLSHYQTLLRSKAVAVVGLTFFFGLGSKLSYFGARLDSDLLKWTCWNGHFFVLRGQSFVNQHGWLLKNEMTMAEFSCAFNWLRCDQDSRSLIQWSVLQNGANDRFSMSCIPYFDLMQR